MISVGKLLESKGNALWVVHPDDSVFDAIKLMDEKGAGALVVVADDALVGIISERDYARKVILKGRQSKETKVKEIMSRQVYHTFPEQDVEACLAVMTKYHIRHLPVLTDKKLVGMITMGDVVKEVLLEQKQEIEHLEHYISWEESF